MEPVSNSVSQQTHSNSTAQQTSSATSSDYETFLLMLTTQLENQDPTDPADADELAVQLATFSGVEQQTYTNELLNDLIEQTSVSSLAELGGWVGREVLAGGPTTFDGSPVDLEVTVPALADKAELVVYRDDGTEVQRLPLDDTSSSISWAGTDQSGTPMPVGTYWFGVEATSLGQPLSGGTVSTYRAIDEVRVGSPSSILITKAGDEIELTDVVALR